MTHSQNLEHAKPRWKPFGWAVFGVVAILGLIGLVLKALAMVRDGRGIETYRTAWRVGFSWIGLRVVMMLSKEIRARSGRAVLFAPNQTVSEILAISRMNGVITVVATREEAVAFLGSKPKDET